jgi:hypothetical protein
MRWPAPRRLGTLQRRSWATAIVIATVLITAFLMRDQPSSGVDIPGIESPPAALLEATSPHTVDRLLIVPFSTEADLAEGALTALSVSDQLWYQLASSPGWLFEPSRWEWLYKRRSCL